MGGLHRVTGQEPTPLRPMQPIVMAHLEIKIYSRCLRVNVEADPDDAVAG